MLNNLSQLDQNDLKGHIFIGTVVANNDDTMSERIKVSIPRIFETADLRLMPWCGRKISGPVANGGTARGSFGLVPRVGDKVFVEFQHGNAEYPLYWTSPMVPNERPAEANVNYPNRYGWKDSAGHTFYVDVTPGQRVINILHASGTLLRINDDGSITLNAVGPINSEAPQWNHVGPMNITGNVDITGLVTVTEDVIADGISLVNHTHGGVDTGPGSTAPPNP